MQSRKPVDKLTPTDFVAFPVWEYAIDEEGIAGRDETWVRPTSRNRLGRGLYSQLVLASFDTQRSDTLSGFMVISTADAAPDVQPGALLEPGYLPLPFLSRAQALARKRPWDLDIRRDLLRGLRRRDENVFPINYRVLVPVGKGQRLLAGKIR